jgi:hypothetical protein
VKFFILFIYSSAVFSICQSAQELPLTEFIADLSPILEKPWAAASDEQVEKHKCQTSVPTLTEMAKYLDSRGDLSKSLNLLLNKDGSLSKDPISTNLENYGAQDCNTDICRAKMVFGNSEGIELLYLIEKYGLNGSHLVHEKTKPWTSKMIAPYLKGLSAVPSFMLPISKNQQFTKSSTDSKDIADASITFYGGIDDFTDTRVTYTTFHEIAHYVAGSIHIEDDEKWMDASGWKEKFSSDTVNFAAINTSLDPKPLTSPSFNTTRFGSSSLSLTGTRTSSSPLLSSRTPATFLSSTVTDFQLSTKESEAQFERIKKLISGMENDDQESFVSRYAQTNPLEDIAESITAYRFNPEKLKEISPQRYNYIKEKVFLGVEYLTDSSCEAAAEKRQQFESIINSK